MSTKDNKPDLSNLKSRLGLKKSAEKTTQDESEQAAEQEAGGQATATKQAANQGGGGKKSAGGVDDKLSALKESTTKSKESQPSADRAQPAQSAQTAQSAPSGAPSPKQGPPPGAKGPPPTAMARPSPSPDQSQPSSSPGETEGDEDEDIDLGEIDLDQGSMFSAPVLVLFAVLAVVGTIFGFLASQSFQTRQVEQTRIDDAQQIQERLVELQEEFSAAHEIISGLDAMDVDFDAAAELEEFQFVYDPRFLPGNRLLLGDQIIGPLHRYMADSERLFRLMVEHSRATTRSDRDELEAFMEEREAVGEDQQVAVVFDLPALQRHFIADEEPHEYQPLKGRLVRIDDDAEPDEEGMIDVHVFASDAPDTLDIRSLVPIVESDFIDVDTDNALQRHQQRVDEMQELADELEGRLEGLMESVEETATADPPPLFTLRASGDAEQELEEAEELPEMDEAEEG